ncbi:MAG: hypothetical protein ABI671_12190 [Burkholderiales bacterium]
MIDEDAQQAAGALFSVDKVVTQARHSAFHRTLPIHQKSCPVQQTESKTIEQKKWAG